MFSVNLVLARLLMNKNQMTGRHLYPVQRREMMMWGYMPSDVGLTH